jgi:hypothetical protein
MSQGIGLGQLSPKVERKAAVAAVAVKEKTKDDLKSSNLKDNTPSEKIENISNSGSIGEFSDVNSQLNREQEDLSQILKKNYKNRRRTKFKAPSSRTAGKQRSAGLGRKSSSIVAHLIDLGVASVGFFMVFVGVLGYQANWDKAFLVDVINELGVAYIALFSYGAFILYHFVFRMLRIKSLGKIITRGSESSLPMSPKGKEAR